MAPCYALDCLSEISHPWFLQDRTIIRHYPPTAHFPDPLVCSQTQRVELGERPGRKELEDYLWKRISSSFATVKELCRDGNVLEGFTTTGGIERDGIYLAIKDERATEVRLQVRDWLRRIKVLS